MGALTPKGRKAEMGLLRSSEKRDLLELRLERVVSADGQRCHQVTTPAQNPRPTSFLLSSLRSHERDGGRSSYDSRLRKPASTWAWLNSTSAVAVMSVSRSLRASCCSPHSAVAWSGRANSAR